MPRLTLLVVIFVALYLGLQPGSVSAKECLADVTYAPDPVMAGVEAVITYSSLGLDHTLGDPNCVIGAGAESEPVFRLFVVGPGRNISVDMKRITSWQYRAVLTFPVEGNWELSFRRDYPQSKTALRSEQNRFTVDVLAAPELPSTGFGNEEAGVQTDLLAYALTAFGTSALLLGAVARLAWKRT